MARLKDYYKAEVAPALMKKFSYSSVMEIPKLDKIVINVGAGEAKDNSKAIDAIMTDLSQITGQRPQVCKAKKSVTSEESIRTHSTAEVTTLSVSRNSLSSLKSTMIRSTRFAEWTSVSLQPQRPTKSPKSFSL